MQQASGGAVTCPAGVASDRHQPHPALSGMRQVDAASLLRGMDRKGSGVP